MIQHLTHLVLELRRRKVLGVAAGYAVFAWAILEVTSTVLQMAGAPAWIARVVLAVVALGFPIALVLAWFFDLSPTGLVRTGPADESAGGQQEAVSRGPRIIGAALILAAFMLIAAFAIWIRPSAMTEVEFTQLTNFADAATAPALSRDGRMLVFLKGSGFFGNSAADAQVYIKQLPAGEATQLTHSAGGKATPAFSPDGSRVTFTLAASNFRWSTRSVSINGGHESELLPNASGLTWLDDQHVLFSEAGEGLHMGLRRSDLSRAEPRDVYWPASELGMAHRSAVSPDGRWVLVVEMDAGVWQPCRLVALDGASPARRVGPLDGQCTYAGWSPDGRWMYFSSNAGGNFHLWRQRFPKGEPQQLTRGPTEEEGIAVAPDGRSLITSAGVRHNSISLMGRDGDRQISVEQYTFSPITSRDGSRLYFLSRADSARVEYNVGNLVVTSLSSGAREQVLPGHPMVHFDLSADDRMLVFVSGGDTESRRGIWVAPLDRRSAPRRVYPGDTERAFFDPDQNIYFLARDGRQRFLHRLRAPDYTVDERLDDGSLYFLFSLSPDGEWAAVVSPREDGEGLQQTAISTRGLPRRVLCSLCGLGAGPARLAAPAISWTRDGSALLVSGQFVGATFMGRPGTSTTAVVPVRPGAALPDLPPEGVESLKDYLEFPGAREVAKRNVLPGASPDQLFFYETTTIRNLYRVKLPD